MLGLYIHIPFCTQLCPFCDFTKLKSIPKQFKPYIDACCREIYYYSQTPKRQIETVFFGGGTPSVLPIECYHILFETLHAVFDMSSVKEIGFECNPENVSESYIKELMLCGVTRFSLGVQRFNQADMDWLGRVHSVEESMKALEILTRCSDNVSVDLMFGLPNSSKISLQESIRTTLLYRPQHISCYGLTIEPNTPFYVSKVQPASQEQCYEEYEFLITNLEDHGYFQYEVSSFALPGFECKHNLKYWLFENYIGIGLGAHSLMFPYRYHNSVVFSDYIRNSKPIYFLNTKTELSFSELLSEHVIANLRIPRGVLYEDYKKRYNIDLKVHFKKEIETGVGLELIEDFGSGFKTTKKGLYLLNEVCLLFV